MNTSGRILPLLILSAVAGCGEPRDTIESWLVGAWRSEYYYDTELVEAELSFREWEFAADGDLRMRWATWSGEYGVEFHGPSTQVISQERWNVTDSHFVVDLDGTTLEYPFVVVSDGDPATDQFNVFASRDRDDPTETWVPFQRREARPHLPTP